MIVSAIILSTSSPVAQKNIRLAFGEKAAPAMRQYYDRWEDIWERGGEDIRYNTGRDWRSTASLTWISCIADRAAKT